VDVRKPTLSPASFLLYTGGLTVLGAAAGALGYLASHYGDAAFAGWALLVLAVLYAIALGFKRRGRWIAAGIFAFAAVIAWAVFVGALYAWWGWLDNTGNGSPFKGFSVARLSFELLVLAAVFDDLRRFRFPFIAAIGVPVAWLFVTDLVSGGGSWTAVVTLFVGLVYLGLGAASDRPTSFWLQLGSGLLIGGALLYWWHSSDAEWALVSVVALVFVAISKWSNRSSWAWLASLGLLFASTHFATEWGSGSSSAGDEGAPVPVPFVTVSTFRGWVPPLVFAFTGFLIVVLGLWAARRPDV
jgi:hypothetical protein